MRKRIAAALLAPLLCIVTALALSVTAEAANKLPDGSDYKLALHLVADHPMSHDELPLEGVEYHLYQVGHDKYIDSPEGDDGYYIYEPADRFREAFEAADDPDMDLDGLDFWSEKADSLIRMTEKLAAYVEDTSIPEDLAATTNSAGEAAFAGLSPGLYLALGDPVVKNLGGPDGPWTFIPQAALIPVPLLQPDDEQWIFIVNIDVKLSQDPPPGLDDLIPVSVRKVWEGDLEHPGSVTVELLADGMAFEGVNAKVVLSEENNWSYTWPLLSSRYHWTVREEVPSGWQASYAQNGIDFTITNRPMPPDDPASTPSSAPKPRPTPSGGPVKSRVLHGSSISSRLPQTGQLWWPVPLLAATGVLLLVIGAILSIGREESEAPYE